MVIRYSYKCDPTQKLYKLFGENLKHQLCRWHCFIMPKAYTHQD